MVKELEVKTLSDINEMRAVLASVRMAGAQYILKDNGEPEAALLSIADLALLQRMQSVKERAWEDFFENLHAVHVQNAGFSAAEVEAEVDAVIRDLRQTN